MYVDSRTYYYLQFSTPGGTAKQAYVGPRTKQLDELVRRFQTARKDLRDDREQVISLSAALRAGGAAVIDASSARVIAALAASGVFKLGGVLVGAHAFIVIGNMLGVRWTAASARTGDVDIAASSVLEVAIPELTADVPKVVESLGMGFLPVPGFSPKEPSTSFKVRGRGLRLDLLTPARGASAAPVRVPRFNAAAAPVRFLEYVLEEAQPGAVIDGGGILVNVPEPARFGVHKLLVAQDRSSAFQTKAEKDVAQAALVLEAVMETRPGDIDAAWRDASSRGASWKRALAKGRTLLARRRPAVFHRIEREIQ